MDKADRDTLASLARHLGWPSISVYLPTHRSGQDKEQDPLRLKNLLTRASREIQAGGVRTPDAEALLKPAFDLLHDPTFWRETAEGLAFFVSEDLTVVLQLDYPPPELAIVNDRFVIRHLLPSIHSDERFWLLALSKNQVRLFKGDHEGLQQIPLRDTPADFKEAMRFEDADHPFRFRTESGQVPGGGRRGSVFYGMGGLSDAEKDQVWRYAGMVERGVRDATNGSDAPLVLAGVEYIVSAYRGHNTYPGLLDPALYGNPDELTLVRLHSEAMVVLRPYFDSRREADYAELESLAASHRVATDVREIVPAAHEGRVRVLFISAAESEWGGYDPQSGEVRVSHEREPGDWDLADLAATETILHGGEVHVLDSAEQTEADMRLPAAIFRY